MVEFQTYNDMKRAIEKLDGTEINGRKIKMIPDKQSHLSSSRRRSDILNRGSYMSAHVLLNLLNELGKKG